MVLHIRIWNSRLLPDCLLISRCPSSSAPFLHSLKPVQAKSACHIQAFRSVLYCSFWRPWAYTGPQYAKNPDIYVSWFSFGWTPQPGGTEQRCGPSPEPQTRCPLWSSWSHATALGVFAEGSSEGAATHPMWKPGSNAYTSCYCAISAP